MFHLISTGATYLFPGARALKLVKNGVNITNSTNPLVLTKNITLTVVDCCCSPPFILAAHCVGAGSVIVASVVNPNPITIGTAVNLVTEIYDHC